MSNRLICLIGVIVFILLVAASIKSICKRLSSGCCGSGGKAVRIKKISDREPDHYPYMAELKLDGMVCASCANAIANSLNSLDGVWAVVSLGEDKAVVRMKERLDPDMLRRAVRAAGPYTVLKIIEKGSCQDSHDL